MSEHVEYLVQHTNFGRNEWHHDRTFNFAESAAEYCAKEQATHKETQHRIVKRIVKSKPIATFLALDGVDTDA